MAEGSIRGIVCNGISNGNRPGTRQNSSTRARGE